MPNELSYIETQQIDGKKVFREFTAFQDGDGNWRASTDAFRRSAEIEVYIEDPATLEFVLDEEGCEAGKSFILDSVVADDELADDWTHNARQKTYKITGNGFTGLAQRVVYLHEESLLWAEENPDETDNPYQFPGIIQEGKSTPDTDYIVSLWYRSTKPLYLDLSGAIEVLPPNTGSAASIDVYIRSGSVGTDFKVYLEGTGEDWFEVDDLEVKLYSIVRFEDVPSYITEFAPVKIGDSNYFLAEEFNEADDSPRALTLFKFFESGQVIKKAEQEISQEYKYLCSSQNQYFGTGDLSGLALDGAVCKELGTWIDIERPFEFSLLFKMNSTDGNINTIIQQGNWQTQASFQLCINGSDILTVRVGNSERIIGSAGQFSGGDWHFVEIESDGTNYTVTIDGTLLLTTTVGPWPDPVSHPSRGTCLGGMFSGSDSTFYNYGDVQLALLKINQDENSIFWPLVERDGLDVVDYSGNGIDGLIEDITGTHTWITDDTFKQVYTGNMTINSVALPKVSPLIGYNLLDTPIMVQTLGYDETDFLFVATTDHFYTHIVELGIPQDFHSWEFDDEVKDCFVRIVEGKMILFTITTDALLRVYNISIADSPVLTKETQLEPYTNVEASEEVLSFAKDNTVTFFSLGLEPNELFTLNIPSELREVNDQYLFTFNQDNGTDNLDTYLALSSIAGMDYTLSDDPDYSVPYSNFVDRTDGRFQIFPVIYDVDREVPTVFGYDPYSTKVGRRVINNLRNCYHNISQGEIGTLVSSKYMSNLLRNSVAWLLRIDTQYLDSNQGEDPLIQGGVAYESSPHVKLLEKPGMILQTDMEFRSNVDTILEGGFDIKVPAKYLPSTVVNDLTFENKDVKVTFDTSGDLPIARFDGIIGDESDIQNWWRYIDKVGEETGTYLHDLLDKRTNRVGTPELSDLQTNLNPAKFLLHHILSKGTILVFVEDTLENRRLVKDIEFKEINTVLPLNTGVIILYTSA
jgi:hypothetical protein